MIGNIYLIPTFLSSDNTQSQIADDVKYIIKNTTHFAVENLRTSRRFISNLHLDIDISTLHFYQMDKQFRERDCPELFSCVRKGQDLGIMSEAGLPGIADPGHIAVKYAHNNNINVIPMPGASSIILGLISSGFSGQHFVFHGYLPIDKQQRSKSIKSMEAHMLKNGYTQIFMETPYRNQALFDQLVSVLQPQTELFIGSNISGKNQSCITRSIKKWRTDPPQNHKIPTIFAIGI